MSSIFLTLLERLGEYAYMVLEVFVATLRKPPKWRLIRDQFYSVGVASMPVVTITGFATGMVLAAQSYFHLQDKGLASATGLMVTKSMMVELGPVLTAFMVTGRVGAAMCAEIGTMKVTEQLDALKSMAINPMNYLIGPRFLAGTLMLPLLTVYSALMGVWGGYFVAVNIYHVSPASYFEPLHIHIKNFDFFMGITKAFIFGFIFVTISCFQGLRTKGGAAGVGRSTTQSVVLCYVSILIVNFLVTVGLNSFYTYLTDLANEWF